MCGIDIEVFSATCFALSKRIFHLIVYSDEVSMHILDLPVFRRKLTFFAVFGYLLDF